MSLEHSGHSMEASGLECRDWGSGCQKESQEHSLIYNVRGSDYLQREVGSVWRILKEY